MFQNLTYSPIVLCAVFFSISLGENCISHISNEDVLLQTGDSISLEHLRNYFRNAHSDLRNVARFIYIYDPHLQTLTSCRDHLRVSVQKVLTSSHVLDHHRPIPFTINNVQKEPVYLSNLRFDRAKSVSFLHEHHSNRLLAILAPQFHLVRVNTTGKNVVLVDNTHRLNKDSNKVSTNTLNLVSHMLQESTYKLSTNNAASSLAVRQESQRDCTFSRKMEIDIMWDQSLCSQFDNNATYTVFQIGGAIANVIPIFELSTCVSIVISSFHGFCKDGPRNTDPLGKLSTLEDCDKSSKCRPSTQILKVVRNYWGSRKLYKYSPDASLFISGYDDGTSVAGAAYVGGVCTKYKFGWVEKLRHQFISHEIGHLLGARHDKEGLMHSLVDIETTSLLSEKSANEISNFLKQKTNCWCLDRVNKPRNNWTPFPLKLSIASLSGDLKPESVYVLDSQYFRGIKLVMLIRNKTDPLAPLTFIRYERLSRSGEEFSSKTRFWKDRNTISGPYKIPLDMKWPLVSAAITMSQFNLPTILVVQDDGSDLTALYLVAGAYQAGSEPQQWSTSLIVPVKFKSGAVSSCSVAKVQNDLIFVFSTRLGPDQSSIHYIIGKSVLKNGFPSNGWTSQKQVPIAINGSVVALNVFRTDILSDGMDDLIFSYIMIDSKGKTSLKFISGFELSGDGTIDGGWSPEVAVTPVRAGKVKQTSIGYAVLVTPRWFKNARTGKREMRNLPSIGFIDTLEGRDFYRLVLQHDALSNGIFYKAEIVENGKVIPACAKCYSKRRAEICVDSRLECSEAKATLPILENDEMKIRMTSESVQTSSATKNTTYKRDQRQNPIRVIGDKKKAGYPDNVGNNELYCAGVYKLFIEKSAGPCAGLVSDARIVRAGLASVIEDSLLEDRNTVGTNNTQIESDVLVGFSWNGTTPGGALNSAFVGVVQKGPSQINVYSKHRKRDWEIYAAIKTLQSKNDYRHWFRDSKKKPRIRRKSKIKKGKYNYVAIVDFPYGKFDG